MENTWNFSDSSMFIPTKSHIMKICLPNILPVVDFLHIMEMANVQGMTDKIPFLTVNLITSHDANT